MNLFALTLTDLRDLFVEKGFAKFSADQVYNWVYRHHNYDVDSWTNVSEAAKSFIKNDCSLELPKVLWQGLSKDGTRKFLMGMSDQKSVETVVIPAMNRRTICVSSQVGCAIGCTFCHTGTMGLTRHLKAHEITGQLVAIKNWLRSNAPEEEKISNLVFMGQGEPLHNFENVKKACQVLLEPKGLGMGQRKVTLSTSGLVPQIEKFNEFPPVNVAISLHAAHDHVRSELMPINKAYDLKRLFAAIKKIPLKAHRHITYEYILIKDLNDGEEDIQGLAKLLDKRVSKINLIPFNEYPESRFKRPSDAKINWFQTELSNMGYTTTCRVTKGTDILAACGQLKSLEKELNLWDKTSKEAFV